jgi:hypothetical protein
MDHQSILNGADCLSKPVKLLIDMLEPNGTRLTVTIIIVKIIEKNLLKKLLVIYSTSFKLNH